VLAVALGGCVGTAGISTWEYQSAPGFEMERAYDDRIQVDGRGLRREACRSVSRRQAGGSGSFSEDDVIACRSR